MKRWLLFSLLLPVMALAQNQTTDEGWDDDDWGDEPESTQWSGFVEIGLGSRMDRDDQLATRSTLQELRLRVESEWQHERFSLALKADADYDGVDDDWGADIRDLSVSLGVGDNADLKLGRQVQTWGTGDLVFLNDLFPKDFVSFFSGRDDEYLKAPGNAVRYTYFSTNWNADVVWTPVFEPDVYLTGERFSFFSPLAGENISPEPPLSAIAPSKTVSNGEFALRLFRTKDGRETALYAYRGFFKQPTALTESLQATFAPLVAVGGSLRQPLGPGLVNAEASWYLSRDDRDGDNPNIPNDQLRLLLGYEWEPKANFSVGLQAYLENTRDYQALVNNSVAPEFAVKEYRQLFTNRLTYRAGRDRHTWSLFTFYSPSDDDFYLRPSYRFRHSDHWSITAGANLFGGKRSHTFFNQLQDASNAYLRIRYHY